MTNKVSELKSNTKTHTRVVKHKDGTVVVDKTTESNTTQNSSESTKIDSKTTVDKVAESSKQEKSESRTHTEKSKETIPLPQNVYIGLSSQIGLQGLSNPGLELKYRLLPFQGVSGWIGMETIFPVPFFKVENIQVRMSVGVTF